MKSLDLEGLDGIRLKPVARPAYSATEIEGTAAVNLRVEESPLPERNEPETFEEEAPTDPQIPSEGIRIEAQLPAIKMKLPTAQSKDESRPDILRRVSFLAAGIVLLTGLLTWLLRGDSTPEPAPPPADDLVATQSLVGSEDAIASANAALESDKEPVGDLIQTALEEQTSEDKPAAAEAAAAEAAAAEEAQKAAAEAAAAEEARKAAAEAAAAEEARKAAKETTEPPSQPTSIDRYGVPTPMSAIPRNLPPGDSIAKKQANETAFTFPGSFTHNNNAMAVTNRARLNTIVEALQSNNKAIRIVGHTDSSGSATGNLRLGWLRAHSVKKLLVHMGISASRILVQSAGITQPIASNATAEGQAENRRVVILLTQ